MKNLLNYLQQQEKLTIYVGVLLGLVFIVNVELKDTISTIYAQADEGESVESIVNEVVDLEKQDVDTTEEDELIAPAINDILIEEESVDTIETQNNGVSGGIELETVAIVDDEVISEEDEYVVAQEQTDASEEILDANAVPNDIEGCKSWNFTYMPYTAVTCTSTPQYAFLYSDACYTDELTGIRMSEGRYCVAVGSFYAVEIGTKIDLVLANGNIIKCILGDCKSDEHTDETHRFHAIDGSVAEFVVDYDYFNGTDQWASLDLTTIEEIRVVTE